MFKSIFSSASHLHGAILTPWTGVRTSPPTETLRSLADGRQMIHGCFSIFGFSMKLQTRTRVPMEPCRDSRKRHVLPLFRSSLCLWDAGADERRCFHFLSLPAAASWRYVIANYSRRGVSAGDPGATPGRRLCPTNLRAP